jgi:hypothetical protein
MCLCVCVCVCIQQRKRQDIFFFFFSEDKACTACYSDAPTVVVFSLLMAFTALQTFELHRRHLLQLLKDEVALQQQLEKQQWLLQRISDASVNLTVWWRDGAGAAAVSSGEVQARLHGGGPSQHPLLTFPGLLFYSLGELLRLAPAAAPPDTVADHADSTDNGVCDESSRHVTTSVSACGGELQSPGGKPWTLESIALQAVHAQLLPTPSLLVRHRLLDPSPTVLPPTHALLLGSLTNDDFPNLLRWLHRLAVECEESLQRLRPDQPEGKEGEWERFSDSVGSPGSNSHAHFSHEQEVLSSQQQEQQQKQQRRHIADAAQSCPPSRTTTKRPRNAGSDATVTQQSAAEEIEGTARSWDPLPWSSLCASLHRLLSFLVQMAELPSSLTSDGVASTAATVTVSSWEVCWTAWTADQHNRAQLRFFIATLCGMHAALHEVCHWYAHHEQLHLRDADSTPRRCHQQRTAAAQSDGVVAAQDVAKLARLVAKASRCMAKRLPEPPTK